MGGCTPRPRKLRNASRSMTEGMVNVVYTITGPRTLGNDVPKYDPAAPEAERPGRFDEFHALNRQHLAANDPRHRKPFHGADGKEKQVYIPSKEHHEQDDKYSEGEGVHDIDDPHHYDIGLATGKAGGRPIGDSNDERDDTWQSARPKGKSGPP